MMKARLVEDWVVCGNCGKKLCKVSADNFNVKGIEIKCRRCGEVLAICLTSERSSENGK